MAFKAGDRVQVTAREITSDDERTGLYYSYFGGLTGKVDRVYDDNSVCVDIDLESLTEDTRERHLIMQENEQKRWLDGLSGEARNRLTAEQKQLKLSYKILVSEKDLTPIKGDKPRSGKKAEKAEVSAEDNAPEGESKGPARTPEPAPKRLSEADLSAAEEEYLRSLQNK
jgi:hypothetical protein